MASLHAVKRERHNLRIAQAKTVMPLIGPLLDAWENAPNDLRSDIESFAPQLAANLEAIATAVEGALIAPGADTPLA
jgi:hypothetical protein